MEAAVDLGANRWQKFRRVVWPLTLPGVIGGALLVFLPALSMFYVADLLGGAKSLLVGNFIKNQFLSARNWPFGAAASAVLLGIMALLMTAQWLVGAGWGRRLANCESAQVGIYGAGLLLSLSAYCRNHRAVL